MAIVKSTLNSNFKLANLHQTFTNSRIFAAICKISYAEAALQRCSYEGVLKICSKFTGEHPCRSAISIKLLAWVFPCKFTAYFQNTFSEEHLLRAASGMTNFTVEMWQL